MDAGSVGQPRRQGLRLLGVVLLLTSGCVSSRSLLIPQAAGTTSYPDIVTREVPGTNLESLHTFTTMQTGRMDAAFEQTILFLARSSLEARGYSFVASEQNPQFVVTAVFGGVPTGTGSVKTSQTGWGPWTMTRVSVQEDRMPALSIEVRSPDGTGLWSASGTLRYFDADGLFLAQYLVTSMLQQFPWCDAYRTLPTTPLGLRLTVATTDSRSFYPVVTAFDDAGKAQANDLRLDDMILAVRGQSLRNMNFAKAAAQLSSAAEGDAVAVFRRGERLTLRIRHQ